MYHKLETALEASDAMTKVVLLGVLGLGVLALLSPSRSFRLALTAWYVLP